MEDQVRYHKDKATVIAIIKYFLYFAIAAAILYLSSKVIIIIVPFLLGFVLAKASRHLANGIIRFSDSVRSRHKAAAVSPEAAGRLSSSRKTLGQHSRLYNILFPPKTRLIHSRRTKVSVFIYILLLIVIIASLVLAASALVVQANKFLNNFPKWITQSDYVSIVVNWVSQFSTEKGGFLTADQLISITAYINNIRTSITNALPGFVSNVLGGIISAVGDLPMILFYIIVIIMSGFYFLTDSRMVFKFLSRNIKSYSFRHKSILLVDRLSTTLFRVLGGYMLLLLVTFIESLVIFWIADINYAVVFALITAILDFMPVLGVSATMVPLMVYLALTGDFGGAVVLLIGMGVITVIRRFLEPPVLGSAMHMHPLATLFAMIFGVALWGPIGFLMGPVVMLVLVEAFKGFSIDKKLREAAGNILNKFSE